jgi:hypothetical protein
MGNPSKEIVTVSVPKGELDNDYTFFEDGKIRYNYDQNANKTGLEAWISARNISTPDREKILKACPAEHRAKVAAILKG